MNKGFGFLFEKRFIFGLRVGLGALFLLASVMKFREPLALVKAIEVYRILPEIIVPWLAISLLFFELFIGLLLVSGWQWRVGALGAGFSLLVFLIVLLSALVREIPIECSCFGAITFLGVTPQAMLFRNTLLLLMATICYVAGFKNQGRLFRSFG